MHQSGTGKMVDNFFHGLKENKDYLAIARNNIDDLEIVYQNEKHILPIIKLAVFYCLIFGNRDQHRHHNEPEVYIEQMQGM